MQEETANDVDDGEYSKQNRRSRNPRRRDAKEFEKRKEGYEAKALDDEREAANREREEP